MPAPTVTEIEDAEMRWQRARADAEQAHAEFRAMEDKSTHGAAARAWLDRQILIGGVNATERAVVERLVDDLEAG